ncbi:tetratricopeptide repeat protein [Marinicella sp. S1101]|uniref:tetratricopeptide repeat protein n=1 Tax=Marinicella marina TaxID=2996016 RepID=UPI002260C485|nr:tetratricopeptide repeat protein [Marinicella marina]MCX7553232.1 tetratricopeptide repeat protein [Marinicella marina]MDJ1138964.1 tetratricopeptide repeat protein [Marinicella marina]
MQRQNKKNLLKTYAVLLLAALLLSNCSNRKAIDVEDSIRDPSAENDSLIQVNPMIPEAVRMLLLEADESISQGQGSQAIMTLKRALSISPNSALVQQHLAEAYLTEADYQEALYWSSLVVNQGPDQGELCERSRRTQALAAELMGRIDIQATALESLISCSTRKPARF